MGTTGSSKTGTVNVELPDILARIRDFTSVPLAVGFGVSTRQHFETVAAAGADGVVIGSRLVDVIRDAPTEQLSAHVENYCREISLNGQEQAPKSQANGSTSKSAEPSAKPSEAQQDPTMEANALPARFGQFGGQYVPEALVDCLVELEAAHKAAMADPEFWEEWRSLFAYMNRPSNLYLAENLTKHADGAKIWLKREDL
jgi:tryptophan synthase